MQGKFAPVPKHNALKTSRGLSKSGHSEKRKFSDNASNRTPVVQPVARHFTD